MITARSEIELKSVGVDYVASDLGTAEGCARAVAETERRLGPIEILVVNHGIGSAHERLVWEQEPETWRRTMQVNLDKPIPVLILYSTAVVEPNGDVHFFDDIYGYDAELEQALEEEVNRK